MTVVKKASLNLAYWLAKVHPEIFNALKSPAAQAERVRTRLAALGDDSSDLNFAIDYPSGYGPPADSAADLSFSIEYPSGYGPSATPSIDPALVALPSSGASTSSSLVSGFDSALSSIGKFLGSAPGINALTNLATAIFKPGTPQAATIATQIARTQTGVGAAPLTYGYNSAGQWVPVLAQPNSAAGIALNPQTLAALGVPPSIAPYVAPALIGLVLYWALSRKR